MIPKGDYTPTGHYRFRFRFFGGHVLERLYETKSKERQWLPCGDVYINIDDLGLRGRILDE